MTAGSFHFNGTADFPPKPARGEACGVWITVEAEDDDILPSLFAADEPVEDEAEDEEAVHPATLLPIGGRLKVVQDA